MSQNLEYIEFTGTVNSNRKKLGYLPQSIKEELKQVKTLDFLLKKSPTSPLNPEDYGLLGKLKKTLQDVSFSDQAFEEDKLICDYSGGEVVKLGLAKLLLREPDVLLLDEPTNDLDLNTILFLENFIQNEERPILYISHDEALLENTANGIIHLVQTHKKSKAQSFFEKCSYKEYKVKRNMMLDSQAMIAKKERSNFRKKMERYQQVFQKVEHLQNQTVRDPSAARLLAKKIKSMKSTEK